MDLTFARTRHQYDSYTDFHKLVELSGFPTCWVDEMELENSEKKYIVSPMNGEFHSHIDWEREKRCEIFHWNLERPGHTNSHREYIEGNQELMDSGRVDCTIVSDKALAQVTGFHFVPLGSHEGLGTVDVEVEKEYDFIHLMCYSLRRAEFFDYMTPWDQVFGCSIAPNGWGQERHESLLKSRFMLNIHQDEWPFLEPLRFALASAYGLPIVTEFCANPYPYEEEHLIMFRMYSIKSTMKEAVEKYEQVRKFGIHHFANMTGEFTFRKCLERFL